jgi:hypothetical protein
VARPEAGVLVEERTGAALAEGVRRLLASAPAPADVRAYAESFSWDDTSRAQLTLFRRMAGRTAPPILALRRESDSHA